MIKTRFFAIKNSLSVVSQLKLQAYCRYWWQIQAPFTLGLVRFLGTLSQEVENNIESKNFEKEGLLKKILQTIAPAIFDEMGLGRDPYGLFHHDLFMGQVQACTGLSRQNIDYDYDEDHNMVLRKEIRESFGDVLSGLSMMYVVEKMAPEIFKNQKDIFLLAKCEESHLIHSILHETLEEEHANEAEEMLVFLYQLYPANEVDKKIEHYKDIWKKFLDQAFVIIS